ncbi:MAG TPA: sigma-70 family RNA polymerase sigma factor [Gemmatimonadales bacterium]|jgi:RNA polymerase sigma-70 factor (ECF subfamily)|nr:sigma-70 family RNA polymerase sigma factor [Gemmatimonadales bacterium]
MGNHIPELSDPESPPERTASRRPGAVTDESQAVEGWYAAYGRMVYNYARFHLASPDAAEDVTAETFLKVFRAAERYDRDRASPWVWILRIARNTLRDHLRRGRLRSYVPIGAMRDLVWEAPSPEERLIREEQVARLLAAVAELPVRDREIVSLRYGSELDTAQVAALLGLRESAVRTRLWRALGRLRALLEGDS